MDWYSLATNPHFRFVFEEAPGALLAEEYMTISEWSIIIIGVMIITGITIF